LFPATLRHGRQIKTSEADFIGPGPGGTGAT
jgi:hypothetical protein